MCPKRTKHLVIVHIPEFVGKKMITHRNSYEVKLDIRPNGLLCVPVKINGEVPFLFVLDTGCGGNWISPEVA